MTSIDGGGFEVLFLLNQQVTNMLYWCLFFLFFCFGQVTRLLIVAMSLKLSGTPQGDTIEGKSRKVVYFFFKLKLN